MTQNYNNTDQKSDGSQALIESDKNSNALTIKGKSSLLALTDSILKSAIAARKVSQLAIDESWMDSIWEWADSFRLSEEQVPRNKNSLRALKELDVAGMNISKLPESIGKLVQLM